MKKYFLPLMLLYLMNKTNAQEVKENYPVYTGKDLGLVYSKAFSVFKIWAPTAEQAELLFYKEGAGGESFKTILLEKGTKGTWLCKVAGDLKGTFYTFRVSINGKWSNEIPDPYAKAVGVNGRRAMVADLKETNPDGWNKDLSPSFSKKKYCH
jgi:pullulanase